MSAFKKFEHRAPAAQNAVDVFADHWASDLSKVIPGLRAGGADLFTGDSRPLMAARAFGSGDRLDGMRVLELGPLEAGHTYQLERLGAEVLAIEANVEAFLKCLIVKELLGLRRSRFMLGDFVAWFDSPEGRAARYDVVFASGVLYHMPDPVVLIERIARSTDRCFVWTHYYEPAHYGGPPRRPRRVQTALGEYVFHEVEYPDMNFEKFWGGNRPVATWLGREDLLRAFAAAGFGAPRVFDETLDHPHGAAMSFALSKGAH